MNKLTFTAAVFAIVLQSCAQQNEKKGTTKSEDTQITYHPAINHSFTINDFLNENKQLEKDVRGAGLPGPTKVKGRYTENPGTSQEKKVGEKSHVITAGKMGKRKFKKAVEKLGKKYDQDSVLIQRKAGGSSTLKGTSKTSWPGKGKNVRIGSMKPGRTGEFDTKVKNKTFTVED